MGYAHCDRVLMRKYISQLIIGYATRKNLSLMASKNGKKTTTGEKIKGNAL